MWLEKLLSKQNTFFTDTEYRNYYVLIITYCWYSAISGYRYVTSSKRRCKSFLKMSLKFKKCAIPSKIIQNGRSGRSLKIEEKGKNEQKIHPKPNRRRDTLSLERRNVQNHSCVPFILEDVLEKPEKNHKPTMVHPENSGNFIKDQNVLFPVNFVVNPCSLADWQ